MRAAQNQASGLENNAASTAAGYGSSASNISSTLLPFLTRELNTPGGISQQDQTAMLSASQGGAGGLASGLQTGMNQKAAATGNESGFGSSADEIARQREKAAAGGSESIAGQNAMTKLNQQQEGARGLQGLYGTDVGAQLNSLGLQNQAIGQEVNAGSHGWFQNMNSFIQSAASLISAVKGPSNAPGAMPAGGTSGGMGAAGTGDQAADGLGNANAGMAQFGS